MTTLTHHATGLFCWFQLTTNDAESAKQFYRSLFGWTLEDTTVGPGPTFTLFKKQDQPVGAVMQNERDRRQLSMWTPFVAVDSADRTTAEVKQAGGKTVIEPTDAGENGRMAVFEDPTTGVFAVWQAVKKPGASIVNETGAACWNELITNDATKASAFYRKIFGWVAEAKDMPMGKYTVFKKDGAQAAGMIQATPEMHLTHPYWLTYFGVDDCDQSVVEASRLGGRTRMPPTDIPGIGRFSVLSDPQDAYFAIIAMEPRK